MNKLKRWILAIIYLAIAGCLIYVGAKSEDLNFFTIGICLAAIGLMIPSNLLQTPKEGSIKTIPVLIPLILISIVSTLSMPIGLFKVYIGIKNSTIDPFDLVLLVPAAAFFFAMAISIKNKNI